MKLLTLNTHSIIDNDYEGKIDILSKVIAKYNPDVVALQEVMQRSDGKEIRNEKIKVVGEIPLKKDNFLDRVISSLDKYNIGYNSIYFAFKKAYNEYDEGLALLSNQDITSTEIIQLSKFSDYGNYKTRYALGIRTHNSWFYSLHFNWENDGDSPFEKEWKALLEVSSQKKNVWLMGDFNLTPDTRGYELITKSYQDTYMLASEIDNGITVRGEIDGWQGKKENKRIDYIFTSKDMEIKSSKIIFNGKNEEIISDHFGIIVEKE